MKTQTITTPVKSGASGKLVHATPKLITQPSLIERAYSKLSAKVMFSVMGFAAVASWIIGG
jgi:hypothetical protein